MVDAVSSSTASYASLGLQAAESAQAAASAAVQQQAAQATSAAATQAASSAAAQAASASRGPTVVPDFSGGVGGTIVIDYRDPETNQVLVQVPMRTALPQFVDAGSVGTKVGKTIDTEA